MKKAITLFVLIFISNMLLSQSLEDLESYTVDEIYKKLELDYGTLDDEGNNIEYVFVKTELDSGTYEVSLSDGPGDLYEINDTDIFITFRSYFGYAGYSSECILVSSQV